MLARARFLRPLSLTRTPNRLNIIRLYSDKYRSIDELNKQKTEFQFGAGASELAEEADRRERLDNAADGFNEFDPENHPRLKGIKPNSPEWKEQMFLIQKELQQEQEKGRRSWERAERLKALGIGVFALASIISVYSFVMNYKYLKAWFLNKINFLIDESKVRDMKDPKQNKKKIANMVDRLSEELALSPGFVKNLVDSKSVPGLYVFGAFSKNKLPARLSFFDGMLLQDVLISKDYLVAVDDSGKVYHYSAKFKEPIQVDIPLAISRVLHSGDSFYYLSKSGKDLFYGPKLALVPNKLKGWFGSSKFSYPVKKLGLDLMKKGEKVLDVTAGASNLLILSSQGRLFGAVSAIKPINKGQFGLPKFSPYLDAPEMSYNEVYELTNLNNEIVATKEGKALRPRTFSSIASGENFNIASEANGNIWTWGSNSFGQCGKDLSSTEDVQPVPKVAYTLAELEKILKYSLPGNGAGYKFSVKDVFASNESSFIQLQSVFEDDPSKDQELLLSFGAGLKGQLGLSRYMHVASVPSVIKSLVGLTEFDEASKSVKNIGIKDVIPGGDHVFVVLNNSGSEKDVLVFGDNASGQFGNGKTVKSSSPVALPKLIEPSDFAHDEVQSKKRLAKKINNVTTNRLQLLEGEKVGKKTIEQVIAGGQDGSVLFYRAR